MEDCAGVSFAGISVAFRSFSCQPRNFHLYRHYFYYCYSMMFSRQFTYNSIIFIKNSIFYSSIFKQKWQSIVFRNISKQELKDVYTKTLSLCSCKLFMDCDFLLCRLFIVLRRWMTVKRFKLKY